MSCFFLIFNFLDPSLTSPFWIALNPIINNNLLLRLQSDLQQTQCVLYGVMDHECVLFLFVIWTIIYAHVCTCISILLSSERDSEYYRQRTTRTSELPASHHRPPFIMRPAICVTCTCHVVPTLPQSPQRSWWALVLATFVFRKL